MTLFILIGMSFPPKRLVLPVALDDIFMDRNGRILWKNTRSLAQNTDPGMGRERLYCQAFRGCCGAGRILASFRRF